ncbi:pentapeptide repeat-containing protein [Parasphingorhabdus halotolerans]|uniref:Pentapeptide repeat-containing protein n=1 Tax=Parasphingorhabdus halotolerans TaxID=2725558 RepID=A0A6H2DM14_9SPHN|nr:pentapeptide repeat-containing protein [Parasphingorhabdus halotolerans]QJB69394.1 hypothetical protein HF685_08960 [Parasphingorhabdus halotolerans]
MLTKLLAAFVGAIFVLANPYPARAVILEPALTCYSVFDDIWSDGNTDIEQREIDGSALKTPADFKRTNGQRRTGFSIIKGGDFSGWDFFGMPLERTCFVEVNLADTDFSKVDTTGIGFIKSDLTGANMRGAKLAGVLFRDAKLENVDARGADFSDGHFDGGWFEGNVAGWNLDGANMRGFTFACGITLPDGCPVYSGGAPISARGTDFTGATLHSFGLYNIITDGAKLDQTIVGPGQLPQLRTADIGGDLILRGGDSDVRITPVEVRTLLEEYASQEVIASNPSFDCSAARSKVEEEICGESAKDLRLLDRQIAVSYKRAKVADPKVTASQQAWLRARNQCNAEEYAADCIRESYALRKGQLLGQLGESDWLAAGEEALFVSDVLPLPHEFSKTPLFAKITPALVGASMTEILVSRREDGLYSIKGSSVGANAHTCTLGADILYLDKATGWYSIVTEGPAVPVFQIIDDRLTVFENGKADYAKYPEASNYASCGARASFPETMRINIDEQTLERYRKALNEEM